MFLATVEKKKINWAINRRRNKHKQILFLFLHQQLLNEMYEFFLFKENLALKKPTYQQDPYNGADASLFEASNAVDGLKSDLSYSGGQCVFSSGQQTAIWWVNLTSILSIHYVTIYYMTNNSPWGMQLITCINYCYKMISEHQILLLTHLNVLLFFIEPLC